MGINSDIKSSEPLWFIFIVNQNEAKAIETNSYGHTIAIGEKYLPCNYLEKLQTDRKGAHLEKIR